MQVFECLYVEVKLCENLRIFFCENLREKLCENLRIFFCENLREKLCENLREKLCENLREKLCENLREKPYKNLREMPPHGLCFDLVNDIGIWGGKPTPKLIFSKTILRTQTLIFSRPPSLRASSPGWDAIPSPHRVRGRFSGALPRRSPPGLRCRRGRRRVSPALLRAGIRCPF
ncbi:MAG: hypothetical protein DYG98_26855 [Haliscomenobacteraceae bacterium CHB4]|nr:hypothetical protein [Saprospiraceae bacterium]MCE7926677.1 hypothetical protein [Haliscomenobacteraceae bacterium CHB4]